MPLPCWTARPIYPGYAHYGCFGAASSTVSDDPGAPDWSPPSAVAAIASKAALTASNGNNSCFMPSPS